MSKKVKGQKLDLASFNETLPPAPVGFSGMGMGAGGGGYREERPMSESDQASSWRGGSSRSPGDGPFGGARRDGGGHGGGRGFGGGGPDQGSSSGYKKLNLAPRDPNASTKTDEPSNSGSSGSSKNYGFSDDNDVPAYRPSSSRNQEFGRRPGGFGGPGLRGGPNGGPGLRGGPGHGPAAEANEFPVLDEKTVTEVASSTGATMNNAATGAYQARRADGPFGNSRGSSYGGGSYGGGSSYGGGGSYGGGSYGGGSYGGGSYGGGGHRGGGFRSRENAKKTEHLASMPIPTAPKASMDEKAMKSKERLAQEEQRREAESREKQAIEDKKKQEKKEKLERQRLLKEQAEKKKEEEEELIAKEKEATAAAVAALDTILESGSKGAELVSKVQGSSIEITGRALLKQVLTRSDNVAKSNWWASSEYGDALKSVLSGEDASKKQLAALYAVQEFCFEQKYPKIEFDGKEDTRMILAIFSILFNNNFIEGEVFVDWADDENSPDENGRTTAIVHSTPFVSKIRDALVEGDDEEYDDEDEEEEDEIDAPAEFIPNSKRVAAQTPFVK